MKVNSKFKVSVASAALACTLSLAAGNAALANGSFGDCVLTGEKGAHKIEPAVAGQFTVQINLPAVGQFNGDTPETIKDGYEFCLAANIANRLGLDTMKLVNVAFDAIVAGQTKDYDIALAQVSVTEPRKKVVDFSTPYVSSDFGIASQAKNPVTETSIKEGKVGVQAGTTVVEFAQETLKPASVDVFPDTSSLFTALAAGRVDAVITDTSIVLGQVANSNGRLAIVGQYATGQDIAGVYPKGSANGEVIDKIIAELKTDGTLDKLQEMYLVPEWGMSPAAVPFWKP